MDKSKQVKEEVVIILPHQLTANGLKMKSQQYEFQSTEWLPCLIHNIINLVLMAKQYGEKLGDLI